MQVVSVVRNFDMYNRLIRNNPNWKDTVFTPLDNRIENKTIPIQYNSFLDSYDYSKPDWFVFCHEDWEIKEDITPKLETLDKNALYGPIGTKKCLMTFSQFVGQITQSEKDGSNEILLGTYCDNITEVGTFDCQCLIVHSSLIKKHHLRFDENLTWDLYVEDFCIGAREQHNISSYILQLKCQHYSFGNIAERFYTQYAYLQKKYATAKNIYISTCSNIPIGKPIPFSYKILAITFKIYCNITRFFYQKKITKSGVLSIKICKIPVYRRKIK